VLAALAIISAESRARTVPTRKRGFDLDRVVVGNGLAAQFAGVDRGEPYGRTG
jgi:hypothetical protein